MAGRQVSVYIKNLKIKKRQVTFNVLHFKLKKHEIILEKFRKIDITLNIMKRKIK